MQVYRLEADSSVTYARGCKSRATYKDVCDDFSSEVCTTRGSRTVRTYVIVYISHAHKYGYVVLARRFAAIPLGLVALYQDK